MLFTATILKNGDDRIVILAGGEALLRSETFLKLSGFRYQRDRSAERAGGDTALIVDGVKESHLMFGARMIQYLLSAGGRYPRMQVLDQQRNEDCVEVVWIE